MVYLILALAVAQMPTHGEDGPLASSVIINEFMHTPQSSCTEIDGEWIELYNNTGDWINLQGWRITNSYGQEIVLGTYLLPPDGYCILAACGDESLNGGISPNYVYSGFEIHGSGTITLYSDTQGMVDQIQYDSQWPLEPGKSCEKVNPGWLSNHYGSWETATHIFGDGDLGTPGMKNSVYQNSFAQNSWAFIKAFVR